MKRIGFVLMLVFLAGNALAISGVSPGSYEVDFEPNLEKEFVFDFVIEGGKWVDVYSEGDLADLVELSETKIIGRQKVVASLKLLAKIDKPGVNQIRIVAGEVGGLIKINVPYPDEFVELELSAPDVNVGEVVEIKLDVFNRGKLIDVEPRIEIYKAEGELGEIINSISLDETQVFMEQSFDLQLDTTNYSAGDYFAVAIVEYGENVASDKNSFRIGEKRVEVLNYTGELKENKVGKFEINVGSFWNEDIKNIYAEVRVVGSDYSFMIPSTKLEAWGEKRLLGFFDTKEVYGYDKEIEIILHYDGESSRKVVPFKILERFDFVLSGVIVGVLIVIGILIWRGKSFLEELKTVGQKSKE